MRTKVLVGIVFFGALLTSCADTTDETESSGTNPSEQGGVQLSLDLELDGRALLIRGETNLPSGTLLSYEARHENWISDPAEASGLIEGKVVVDDGGYEERVALPTWPAGVVEVWLAFQTILGTDAEQPPAVIEQFGEMGERLQGTNVVQAGEIKRIELIDTLRLDPLEVPDSAEIERIINVHEARKARDKEPSPARATQSFSDRILARNISGGWLNIDFIHTGSPAKEAQRCVKRHGVAEAVACFAFATEEAYRMAQPIDAGNFKGPLCWDARWQRNKVGSESGGTNRGRPPSCPS